MKKGVWTRQQQKLNCRKRKGRREGWGEKERKKEGGGGGGYKMYREKIASEEKMQRKRTETM